MKVGGRRRRGRFHDPGTDDRVGVDGEGNPSDKGCTTRMGGRGTVPSV